MSMGLRRFVLSAVAVVAVGTVTPVSEGDRAIFVPVTQKRLLDTRTGSPIPALGSRNVKVLGVGGVPVDAVAVVVNVAAHKPAKAGFLNVYPAGTTRPAGIGAVNFVVGQVTENLATVKVGSSASVTLFASTATHATMDVAGYYRSHAHDDRYLLKSQAQGRSAADAFSCPTGSLIQSVAVDGKAFCVQDATGPVTGVGAGLLLDNGVLSAQQGRSAANAFSCPAHHYLRSVAADGTPTCAPDVDTDTDTVGPVSEVGPGLLLDAGVLSVNAGPGIVLDGKYGTITAEQGRSVENAFTCEPGYFLRVVDVDGTPTCEPDQNTTYAAGFGLLLDGNVLSAQQGRSAANAFTCSIGQFLRSVAADGTPTCATDANTTYQAGFGLTMSNNVFAAQQGRTAPNAFNCSAGYALRVVSNDGTPTCALIPSYTAGPGITITGTSIAGAHGVTVVPVAGDQAATVNGANLRAAMNSIVDASATKPYVISLAPGVYELGTAALQGKAHVSIVGAGRKASVVTGAHSSMQFGLLNLYDNMLISNLSVRNTTTGTGWVIGIMANAGGPGSLNAEVRDVEIVSTQGTGESYGLLIFNGGNVNVTDSTITAKNDAGNGIAVYSVSSSLITMRGNEVTEAAPGTGGHALLAHNSSKIDFADGVVAGSAHRTSSLSEIKIVHSRIDAPTSGGVTCFGNYSTALAAATCA